jgi:CHAT domain-containing protein
MDDRVDLRRAARVLALVGVFALAGCAASRTVYSVLTPFKSQQEELASLWSEGRYGELVARLQPRLENGQELSSFGLMMLGTAYYEERQYRGALAAADAMDRRVRAGDSQFLDADISAYPSLFRAEVALDLGAYEDAVRYATEAVAHAKAQPGPSSFTGLIASSGIAASELVQIYAVRGVANAFLGRTDEARKDLEAVRGATYSGGHAERFTGIARIHMALREYDKALDVINQSGDIGLAFNSLIHDPTSRDVPRAFIRAKSLYETGALPEAKAAYDDLLGIEQIAQIGGVYWPSLFDRARIALKEGDAPRAIELLRKAIDVIEQQRSSIDSESGRIGFVGDKQAVYRSLIAVLVARGDAAPALDYVERSKARALVDMLASKGDFSIAEGSAERVRQLLAATEAAEIAGRGFEASAEATTAKRRFAFAQREQLARAAPELSALVSVSAVDTSTLRALLPADETLIEYYYGGDELYAFLATREAVSVTRLEGSGLVDDIIAFRRVIQRPPDPSWRESARKLYGRLIAPIHEQLHTPNLVVVPHGALHYLPFNALHDGDRFLVQSYAIRLLPAATVLKFLQAEAPQKPGTLLAFGNPDLGDRRYDLPFAQAEAEGVAKTMPHSRALVRGDASRAAFLKYASDFQFIHIASHGDFEPERPLTSSLLLASAGTDDGRLTVSDLYSLRIGADLVTLSACETGLGEIAAGDDIVGLTRGFLYAGTRTIVASLWQVDDRATGDLMVAFYRSLAQGLSKRDALRAAQIEQLGKQPYPFYWAPFQLTGSP